MATIFAWTNLTLGVLLALFSLRSFRVYRGEPWAWLSLAKILLGLYWAGIYGFVLIIEPGIYDSVRFGQIFIRPALTITLAIIAAGAIMGAKR